MKSVTRSGLVVGGLYLASIVSQGVAFGKASWMKATKDLGLPAQNCLYCHTEKMPKKDTFKPEELNDRGKWLMSEKQKRNASEIDLAWLKEYPGGAEQK
ncbi:MAG TPA: hypothetical protein VG777_06505 [Thermoanaerobaculia bacterium]|nr:hypothetical protein [Thermoanaerobaculia bacterium]